MKRIGVLLLVVVMLGLGGCGAHRPSSQEFSSAYFGAYPDNYQEIIKGYMEMRLIDPDSAKYYFRSPPQQGWWRKPFYSGFVYGYTGVVGINGKNRMGGYTGVTAFEYLIRDGTVLYFSQISNF